MQPASRTHAGHPWVLGVVLLVAVTQLLSTSTAATRWASPDVRTAVTETTGSPADEVALAHRAPGHSTTVTVHDPALPADPAPEAAATGADRRLARPPAPTVVDEPRAATSRAPPRP